MALKEIPALPVMPVLRPAPERVECCATCRFWRTDAQHRQTADSPNVAPCRRYPPTVVLIPVPRPLPGQPPFGPGGLPYPMTPATEWCGEYQLPAVP